MIKYTIVQADNTIRACGSAPDIEHVRASLAPGEWLIEGEEHNPVAYDDTGEPCAVTLDDGRPRRGNPVAPQTYDRLRRKHYPAVEEQLDALWKGGADAEAMRARVMAVKEVFPKDNTKGKNERPNPSTV